MNYEYLYDKDGKCPYCGKSIVLVKNSTKVWPCPHCQKPIRLVNRELEKFEQPDHIKFCRARIGGPCDCEKVLRLAKKLCKCGKPTRRHFDNGLDCGDDECDECFETMRRECRKRSW